MFLSGLLYEDLVHVAVDVVVILSEYMGKAFSFIFISLQAGKWKVFNKEGYQGLQTRQMGNRRRLNTSAKNTQKNKTAGKAVKAEHTQTHNTHTHTCIEKMTDNIINTVPEVYCIPGSQVKGESHEKKQRRWKLSNMPLASLRCEKLCWKAAVTC